MKRIVVVTVAAVTAALVAGGLVGAQGASSQAQRPPAKVGLRTTDLGRILVDRNGRTLYLFEKDRNGRSSCSGACARAWPPVTTTGTPVAGRGVSARKLGTTRRASGKRQVTYNGHPLYRYAGDDRAGDTNGQGSTAYGAAWYVLSASGRKITTTVGGY